MAIWRGIAAFAFPDAGDACPALLPILNSLMVERSIFRSTDRTSPIGPIAAVDLKVDRSATKT